VVKLAEGRDAEFFKRTRFPKEIILVCIRWYAAYALSYRNLEEMTEECGVFVDRSVQV
jgi:putative transposase